MDLNTDNPLWLDKDFLKNILQDNDPSKTVNIISFGSKPAVAAGNNYCCIVLRVAVEYETNGKLVKTSLIVKTPHQEGIAKDMIEEMGVIAKEFSIYKEFLPIVNKMLNKSIAPKVWFCSVPGTIILEDLKEQGYVMCDRLEQLDFDHCNHFMKIIGIFHATSLHVINQKPEFIEKMGKDAFFSVDAKPEGKQLFLKGFNILASVLEEWEGFEHFAKFVRNNESALWDKTVAIHNGKKHLRVLNHGDVWTNNMLFKHDDKGKVIDIKLIDFQICKFASPAIDIISFLLTSAQKNVKEHRLAELYTTYLDSFNSTLKTIGCEERLSLEEFQEEMKFAEILPFVLLVGYVPLVLCEKDNVTDMDKMMVAWNSPDDGGKELIAKLLDGKHFKKVAKYTLNNLEEQGVLTSFT